ncbi:heme NO-binding domain-containing protein [Burkholderiaceae bacterium DAT-1]|nr:heme NO-binding domain-containing protein [Burkholderiaceae bacterium DAT-1]
MYGLVNRAIEQMVVAKLGVAGWQKICLKTGIDAEGFLALKSYPDEITYNLVGAVCEETGLSAAQVLEAFGEYWIMYTADEGYGALLGAAGSDMRTFLHHLDEVHARVETVFPNMTLPWFRIEDTSPDAFLVYYGSKREGLAPMVVGLLKGLGKRFGQVAEIKHLEGRTAETQTDLFSVRIISKEGA